MRRFIVTGRHHWKVWGGTTRSQAAEMVIEPGDTEGGSDNRHPRSDQWLYVVAGRGQAIVEGQSIPLTAGTLLLIEKNERHRIISTGRNALKTMNVYSPPAY